MQPMVKITRFLIVMAFAGALSPAAGYADNQGELRARIIDTAKKYLGARYNYGGMSTSGFDCSGFVQFVFRENGIRLPRSTPDQFEDGKKIELEDAQSGDLVFFRIYNGRISHVGIFVSRGIFIHAPSHGKCVSFANMNLEYWKKTYAGTVTYIGAKDGAPLTCGPGKK
jgi:cell wall-associated NlpC family hydrolase